MHPGQMTNYELDWAVARALDLNIVYSEMHDCFGVIDPQDTIAIAPLARYCTDWGVGGPLLDHFQVSLQPDEDPATGKYETWTAQTHHGRCALGRNGSQLKAAMEAIVCACLGSPVSVPAALRDHER